MNGRSVVTFDGLDDFLSFGSAVVGSTHTLAIVFGSRGNSVGSVFSQWAPSQTGRYLWSANQDSGGSFSLNRLNVFNSSASGSGWGGLAADVAISPSGQLVLSLSSTGVDNLGLYKNGEIWETASISDLYTGVNSGLGTLNVNTGGNYLNGFIAEIVNLNVRASTSDRQRLEGYLAHKWGLAGSLPVGHPWKAAAP